MRERAGAVQMLMTDVVTLVDACKVEVFTFVSDERSDFPNGEDGNNQGDGEVRQQGNSIPVLKQFEKLSLL